MKMLRFRCIKTAQALLLAILIIPYFLSCKDEDTPALSDQKELTNLEIRTDTDVFIPQLQSDGKTWHFYVDLDFDPILVTKAQVNFTLSEGASSYPHSGDSLDLTVPVSIGVLAEDLSVFYYTVEMLPDPEAELLRLDKSNISFPMEGGKAGFSITSNTKWTLSCDDWLTSNYTSGEGNCTVEISAEPNTGKERLFGSVSVTTEKGLVKTLGVTQDRMVLYNDLDRTNWYIAPETDLDGNPLEKVSDAPQPTTATAATGTTIHLTKNKSPYLSHFLPWFTNAGLTATANEGYSSTSAAIDNNSMTSMFMVKGIGSNATTSPSDNVHLIGGVVISAVYDKPWFIIRLDEHQPQKFDYFRMRYRENGGNAATVKPQGVTFFGSNDDSCITDASKWTQINEQVIVPPGSLVASTPPSVMGIFAPGANLESGNVMLPVTCEYKYIKVQYDRWDASGNTVYIAEFWLGLSD